MRYLIKNKFWNFNKEYNKEKLLYLLVDKPNYINRFNDFVWLNSKDEYNREYDLPSIVFNIGDMFWNKNDLHHRDNFKPAVILKTGSKEYWINGKWIKWIK